MEVQNISQEQVNLPFQSARYPSKKQGIKDSLLLIIVFLIGLIGSCYILHFALSGDKGSTGYQIELVSDDHSEELALK